MSRVVSLFVPILLLALAVPAVAKTYDVPGDFSTIQAAIDAAGDGDRVVVRGGVWNENLVIRDLTEFKLRAKKKAVLDLEGAGTAITAIGCTTLKIRGFRIENTGDTGIRVVDCHEVRLKKNRIRECPRAAISIEGGRTFDIYKNRIQDCGDMGIYLGKNEAGEYSRRANVQRMRIERVRGTGVFIEGQLYHAVRKNRIYECGWAVVIGPDAESSRVDKNRIKDSTEGGVAVGGFSTFARYNRIHRTGANAIVVTGTECWIQGNRAKQAGGSLVIVAGEHHRIQGNKGKNLGGAGIELSGTDHFVKKNRIRKPDGHGFLVRTTESEFQKNRVQSAGADGFRVSNGAVDNDFRRNSSKKSAVEGLVDENPPGSNEYKKNSFR